MSEDRTVAERIFSGLGGLLDGAKTLAGDVMEYKLLEKELESQASITAPPVIGADPIDAKTKSTPETTLDTVNKSITKIALYGALGVAGVALALAIAK